MSLCNSYTPNYYSIEDILATQERIPCKFVQDVPNLGKLDSSSETKDLPSGTELELPYWLVESIALGRQAIVTTNLPKIYREAYREILKADAAAVDLHKLNLYFYEVGLYIQKFDTRNEVQQCLELTFQRRYRTIMDLCEQTFMDPASYDRLDSLERKLYEEGHAAKMKLNYWLNETNYRLEASGMVLNHKKRKRLDMEIAGIS